jgi:CRISPR-associated protein Cas1
MQDLDAVVLANEQVTISGPALAGLARAGCGVVVCDEKRMPVGMLLPLTGHSTQAERFRAQAAAPLPLRKRIWKKFVQAKITHQGRLLRELTGDDGGLPAMAGRVKSGDKDNLEAQAAQRYWKRLFVHRRGEFVRRREEPDENALLNYGYAVLRASTARALCAAGLHPGLGIHHHNRYDAYCLADDVMEPFRPLVDGVVAIHAGRAAERGEEVRVDARFKQTLVYELSGPLRAGREQRVLFDLLGRLCASLAAIFLGEERELFLPYLRSPILEAYARGGEAGDGEEGPSTAE